MPTLSTCLSICLAVTASSSALEREPTLAAAELVQPALLTGPHYRVQPYARLEGLHAHFVIETDWGPLSAPSVELLGRRIEEMPLLEALHSESLLSALSDAGVGGLGEPLRNLRSLAADPLSNAARVPGGILRLLRERALKLGDRSRRIGKRMGKSIFNDGSPAGTGPARSGSQAPWWDAPVDEFGRLLRAEAGHDRARRELAQQLGVAAWTGNSLLRERLDTLAWAMTSGRLASERVIAVLSAGATSAIAASELAQRLTAAPSAENQRRQLEDRLQRWMPDSHLSYALAWRSAYPPPLLSMLLDDLESLGAAGGEAFIDTALLAQNEAEALFVVNALKLLLHAGEGSGEGGTLVAAGALIGYLSAEGEFLLPLAVDRLSWTEDVERWFEHAKITAHGRRTVLVAGTISPAAERALTARGWSIRSQIRWPGAPPYRWTYDAA